QADPVHGTRDRRHRAVLLPGALFPPDAAEVHLRRSVRLLRRGYHCVQLRRQQPDEPDSPQRGARGGHPGSADGRLPDGRRQRGGDEVLAYDEASGATGSAALTGVGAHDDALVEYVTIDGERLETTPEHPFYTQERGWVAAGELWAGAHVRRADGGAGVVEAV